MKNTSRDRLMRYRSLTVKVCFVFSVLFLICLCIQPVFALDPRKALTQFSQSVWTSENGLPNDSIRAIVQTRDGYLWVGTENGLARFDGVEFTVFTSENTNQSLISSNIFSLYEAPDGTLWIGTAEGLTHYSGGKFTSYEPNENGLSSGVVYSILQTSGGSLWIGTGDGLNQFKDGKFTVYSTKDGLPNTLVISLFEDHERNLWIGTAKGLARLKDGKFATYTTAEGLPNDRVRTVKEDRNGKLWVGTNNGGLATLNGDRFVAYPLQDKLPLYNINKIIEDRDGNLWLASNGGGVIRLNERGYNTYTVREGLADDMVTSFWEDLEGDIWVGTRAGLVEIKETKFFNYGTKEGLPVANVSSVLEARDGSIWLGTNGGGVSQLKDGRLSTYTTKNGLSDDVVFTLHEGSDSSLWIGTNRGFSRFKDGRFTVYTTKEGLSCNIVNAIVEDRTGTLWIGTDGGGLNSFKDGKFTAYTRKDGLAGNFIRSIYESHDGSLWLAAKGIGPNEGNGMTQLKDGKFTIYKTPGEDGVTAIYEDVDDVLWVGTVVGGLNRFKDGKFTAAYTSKQGFTGNGIWGILEDDRGNIWISNNTGILRVSKAEANDYAAGRIQTISCASYGLADGLRTVTFVGNNNASGCKGRDGKLWFPSIKGLVMFEPDAITKNEILPPLAIEKILYEGKPVSLATINRLAPGNGELEFHYAGLSFISPQRVKFKYKLEGFDKAWVDAGTRREAHYTNLPPGTYRFRVIACNNDGLWNETGVSYDFYLKPHFYQTYWFYGACAAVGILLALALYRLRVRQLHHRTEVLEKVVDERTGELKRSQAKVVKLEKRATEQRMAGGFAHEMRNALAGPKLVLDRALAIDGAEPSVSVSLANCKKLKQIYLRIKDHLQLEHLTPVLADMQAIFANEERVAEILELVHRATARGLNITQQIMSYSKIGQQEPGSDTLDVDALITKIVNEHRAEFSDQRIEIEYSTPATPVTFNCDETHLYSVVNNIVLNARDALTDPSIEGNTPGRIGIKTEVVDEVLSIAISDNGIGIPPENLPKIFEPFFSTKPASGTGLGLGMVKNIVSLYEGVMNVDSEPGKGTTVTVSLPVERTNEFLRIAA